ncbi:NAD(P)H-dependent flavin oxidoreductase [Luteibaculum oceani]|nr:nitronate monooxygenase [Luteibaculum oceani]
MAPMFLVSNEQMMLAGMQEGVMAAFPSLNFRKDGELDAVLKRLNENAVNAPGSYGVNLIVQKSNPLYVKHLDVCVANKVPFYITSLGNPKEVIEKAHGYGGRVFCDVTNLAHARKVAGLGCDGFIAVGAGAGGHAGPNALHVLVERLNNEFPEIPVVAAGGVATGKSMAGLMVLGAAGVSVGTRFISSDEASVNDAYKSAINDYDMDDIVLTEKISGTPCAVINTPFAKKIGYKQNFFEKLLSKNRTIRKYFKMLVQYRGMKWMEKSAKPGNYQTLWSAGQSVGMIKETLSTKEIIQNFKEQYHSAISIYCKKEEIPG